MAFVVSSAIGLDVNSSFSDYVQLHGGDKATLAASLGVIQRTADVILQAIEPCEAAVANPELSKDLGGGSRRFRGTPEEVR